MFSLSFFLARDYNAVFIEDIISNRQSFDLGEGVSFFFWLGSNRTDFTSLICKVFSLYYHAAAGGCTLFVPSELELQGWNIMRLHLYPFLFINLKQWVFIFFHTKKNLYIIYKDNLSLIYSLLVVTLFTSITIFAIGFKYHYCILNLIQKVIFSKSSTDHLVTSLRTPRKSYPRCWVMTHDCF